MLPGSTLFLAHRVWVFHPVAALLFYLLAAAVCVAVLMSVANARGRSPMWSLFGLCVVPGLVVGLLVLIALPASSQPQRS